MTNTSSSQSKKPTVVVKKKHAKSSRATSDGIEQVAMRIITKMAELHTVFGITQVSLTEILKFSGYGHTASAGFIKAKKLLLERGDVVYSSKMFSLTERGLERAPYIKSPPVATDEAYHTHLKEFFESPKAADILDLLADREPHDRMEICRAIGYKCLASKGFTQSIKELRDRGLLENVGKGMIQLTDRAFLPNRRP